jgi:outer membrane protein assembly factor BamB
MPAIHRRPRRGRIVFWVIGLLLVVFLGLAAYQGLYVNRKRLRPDPVLFDELADAEILEDQPASPPADRPWPQWRGPNRDGLAHDPKLLTKWPQGGLKRLWQADGGDGYSSFAVGGGRVFSMVVQPDEREAVVCWRADDTGKELWRYPYDPGRGYQYGGPRATPTLDGDRLYIVSSTGVLLCLRATDGKLLWDYDMPGRLGAPHPTWGFADSPLVEGGRVFVNPGGKGCALAAFDKNSGELAWKSQDDPAGYSSPLAVTAGGVRQIIFFTGTRLVGVAPEDGRLLWDFPFENDVKVNAAMPLPFRARVGGAVCDYVFISTGYNKGCALVKLIRAGDGFQARLVYDSNQFRCHFSSPVRRGNYAYGFDETELVCMDLRTGEVRWRQRGFHKGSLFRVDDLLLILGEQGHLALARADPESYQELARARPLRNKCWTVPVLADGRLYLRDQAKVLCLDVRGR